MGWSGVVKIDGGIYLDIAPPGFYFCFAIAATIATTVATGIGQHYK
jgi:hypothetical protein